MSFLNDRKDKFIIMADNPKRAASVISALDKLRREHYGDMPISTQDIKLVDRVMKLLFGEGDNPHARALREKYPNIDMYKEQVIPILRRSVLLYRQAFKMVDNDYGSFKFEDKILANELARELSAPATTVSLDDDFVRKLAGATAAAVKKAIKPGRGSKNVRYPDVTKEQCQGIWEKYKDNPEVKKHANATRRKVSYNDVFEYAKTELARLEPVHILKADDFKRALGAKSDKKYRNSPTVREKNRDKNRQAVYSSHNNFLSGAFKCRP